MNANEIKDGAIVPAPPRARNRGLQAIVTPEPDKGPENLGTKNAGVHDMNFKMDPDFHRAFKTTAAIKNMAMKELLEASFRCWVEHYGDDVIRGMLPPSSKPQGQ